MITKGYKISAYTLLLMFVSLCINETNKIIISDLSVLLNDIRLQSTVHPDTLDDYVIHSFHIPANCCNTIFYYMV